MHLSAGKKPSGGGAGGADWLGLGGDDDGGLDLGAGSLKPSTPSSQEGRKDTSTAQGIFLRTIKKLFFVFFVILRPTYALILSLQSLHHLSMIKNCNQRDPKD